MLSTTLRLHMCSPSRFFKSQETSDATEGETDGVWREYYWPLQK